MWRALSTGNLVPLPAKYPQRLKEATLSHHFQVGPRHFQANVRVEVTLIAKMAKVRIMPVTTLVYDLERALVSRERVDLGTIYR